MGKTPIVVNLLKGYDRFPLTLVRSVKFVAVFKLVILVSDYTIIFGTLKDDSLSINT